MRTRPQPLPDLRVTKGRVHRLFTMSTGHAAGTWIRLLTALRARPAKAFLAARRVRTAMRSRNGAFSLALCPRIRGGLRGQASPDTSERNICPFIHANWTQRYSAPLFSNGQDCGFCESVCFLYGETDTGDTLRRKILSCAGAQGRDTFHIHADSVRQVEHFSLQSEKCRCAI